MSYTLDPTITEEPTSSSPPQTDYAAALQRYHEKLRDRILDGIWAVPPGLPGNTNKPTAAAASAFAATSNSNLGYDSASSPNATPKKPTRQATPLSPSALALLASQPTKRGSKPSALGSWDAMIRAKRGSGSGSCSTPTPLGDEEMEELGLRPSMKVVNPITNRPFTRSDRGRSGAQVGASENGSGSGSGSGTYVPVRSLPSLGGSLGSRPRRDEVDTDDMEEERQERRSRSRSREVRRIPGLSRERPRSRSRSGSGSVSRSSSRQKQREVSAWSSSESGSESSSSFQSTPRSREERRRFSGRSSRASKREEQEMDQPVVTLTLATSTSPSPASGSVREKADKDVAQIIDYALPLRSPTVFPVSYKLNEVTGEKTERKLARGAKVQALGLGLTAMTLTPGSSAAGSRPTSSVGPSFADGVKAATAGIHGSVGMVTPAESEDSFAAVAPSPLWTPSVNPLIRGRNTTTAEGASLAAGEQPFWSIGNAVPLVTRKGMFKRTLSGLSASRWDVENDCEAPVGDDEDDGLVSDGRDAGFMDGLLEDYQLAHPPTPAVLSRSNSYLGKAFGMTSIRPTMGRSGSYASDKENRSLQPIAVKTAVQHVETQMLAATPIPSPKARRNNSDGPQATSPDSQRRMFRMVRKLTFQRPHHKDGRGKGRGGDWMEGCGEAL